MARPVEHADDDLARLHALGLGDRLYVLGRRFGEVDDPVGIARPHRQFVHIDVGRVQKIAFARRRQHGQRVRPGLGSDGRAFERIERDVDLGPLTRRAADFFADIEHRRLVALAFPDHDRAVHIQLIESLAHRFDRGGVGSLFIAPPDQLGSRDRRRLGHADHFKHEDPVERIASGIGSGIHGRFSPQSGLCAAE